MALSDELERMIGSRTAKGTEITRGLVDAVRVDEATILEIRENNAKVIENAIGNEILLALEEIGIDAERIASENAPVDTGRLSASITHVIEPSENSVYIGTNVPYAAAQELGISSTGYKGANGGRGYLRPAATDNAERYRAILKKHLENA